MSIDISAPWCAPCKNLWPRVEQLAFLRGMASRIIATLAPSIGTCSRFLVGSHYLSPRRGSNYTKGSNMRFSLHGGSAEEEASLKGFAERLGAEFAAYTGLPEE